ncbi:hypothetical protein SpCBS45565_g05769 [Spizellomyces sp. 'palustris']|nr:hypothetical protein SpCBS45565_g05769 [Spizellomyces sp. 'palustris']
MPDLEGEVVNRLGQRLLRLLDAWSEHQDRSCAFFDSAVNLASQREDTLPFLLPLETEIGGWINPITTPAIVVEFPDIASRLLGKQTRALERALQKLHGELRDIQRIAHELDGLNRDALREVGIAELRGKAEESTPTQVSLTEMAAWIDQLCLSYKREYARKVEVLKSMDLRADSGDARARWGLYYWIDLEKETEVRDRMRVMKTIGS